ncbi:hypothetical protein M427DRAFT_65107, partial [Gonapodya prolifera JEL478]
MTSWWKNAIQCSPTHSRVSLDERGTELITELTFSSTNPQTRHQRPRFSNSTRAYV